MMFLIHFDNALVHLYSGATGTRSKIFNEIVFKDNHLLTLHEKCIDILFYSILYTYTVTI